VQFSTENARKNVEQALREEKQMLFSANALFFLRGFLKMCAETTLRAWLSQKNAPW